MVGRGSTVEFVRGLPRISCKRALTATRWCARRSRRGGRTMRWLAVDPAGVARRGAVPGRVDGPEHDLGQSDALHGAVRDRRIAADDALGVVRESVEVDLVDDQVLRVGVVSGPI